MYSAEAFLFLFKLIIKRILKAAQNTIENQIFSDHNTKFFLKENFDKEKG